MTPETFLKEFGAIANAPGGVQRLREMILQLAMMGKLVAQDPSDEPASELVRRIEVEKKTLLANGVIRKEKLLPKIKEIEKPYGVPKSWEWCRLGACTNIIMGQSPDSKSYNEFKNGLPFFQGKSEFGSLYPSPKKWCSDPKKIAPENSILISVRAPVGPTNICNMVACIGRGLSAIQTLSDSLSFYFLYFFRANEKRIETLGTGSTFKAISLKILDHILVPLPPVAEQKRIVAKVDQLMALCDRLEAQQQERSTLVKQARISTLNELANAQGDEALQTAWTRVQDHLPMLFDHPDDVEDLKKCILQNAVMGKLVPQNPDDEPASELLEKIAEEKAALIKTGEIKRPKPLPKIREDEKPFEIPYRWEWCRLGDILLSLQNGIAKRSGHNGIDSIVLRLADVANYKTELSNVRKIPLSDSEIEHYKLYKTDLLVIRVNGSADIVGRFVEITDDKLYHCDHFIRIRFSQEYIFRDYLVVFGHAKVCREAIERLFITTAGQKTINQKHLSSLLFPIPPYNEQTRIAQKVQSLLALCDHLQNQLKKSQTIAAQLAQSIIETITGQSTEKQERMKPPKTELVSKLKLVKKPGAKVHAPLSAILVKNNDELSAKALWNTSGLAIDDFYRQLKTEMVNGWIAEPEKAHVRITEDQGKAQ